MLLAQETVSGSNSQVLWTLGDHQHSIRDYVAYDGSSVLAKVEYNAFGERRGRTVDYGEGCHTAGV